ncbi:MAG: hypothetical protein RQ761_01590 [Bacteroidales bacterium]|nr:hypothetical protein [Bacteroidales bacterium]
MKIRYYILLLIILAIAACKPEIDEFTPEKGDADFRSFLALGNSLTAGYADGALYKSAQEASFVNIMAGQFAYVGGGDFKQPLMIDDYGIGFQGVTPVPKFVLGPKEDCAGQISLAPVRAPLNVNLANLAPIGDQGPFNNIAVPGLKAGHVFFDQLATANPYYGRFAPDPNTPLINLTAAFDATFFSLWLGGNDVLGYAFSGGAEDQVTDPQQFETLFHQILLACINNQSGDYAPAKGVVLNVPDVIDIPFFSFMNTQIPYNGLVLTAEQAVGLNMLYQKFGHPEITFQEGPNPWVVENSDGSWGRMTSEDLFIMTLPTDSIKCFGMGVANPDPANPYPIPIPHKYILDKAETATVRNTIEQYNATIFGLCTEYELAHVDANEILNHAKTGIIIDGYEFTSTFVQGNVFSLDGIHLTPAGSAMIAYYCIEAINMTYGANIPQVTVTDYYGVTFP